MNSATSTEEAERGLAAGDGCCEDIGGTTGDDVRASMKAGNNRAAPLKFLSASTRNIQMDVERRPTPSRLPRHRGEASKYSRAPEAKPAIICLSVARR